MNYKIDEIIKFLDKFYIKYGEEFVIKYFEKNIKKINDTKLNNWYKNTINKETTKKYKILN